MRLKRALAVALLSSVSLGLLVPPLQAQDETGNPESKESERPEGRYAVVVNLKNELPDDEEAARNEVKQLFLKQRSEWEDSDFDSKPFDRLGTSPAHAAFLKHILEMSEAETVEYWLSMKSRTGKTAPRAIKTDRMLLKLVQKYDGAFGFLETEKAKAARDKTRILFTFGE